MASELYSGQPIFMSNLPIVQVVKIVKLHHITVYTFTNDKQRTGKQRTKTTRLHLVTLTLTLRNVYASTEKQLPEIKGSCRKYPRWNGLQIPENKGGGSFRQDFQRGGGTKALILPEGIKI
jgi:hypothetical protein